jgi:hypothetical protein
MARIKHGVLVDGEVTTVTLAPDCDSIEVVNVDGAAAIYFTVDGSTPDIEADDVEVVPGAVTVLRVPTVGQAPYTVQLISAGTPSFSVRAL